MLRNLAAQGPVDEGRVYGPVGLDIGTDGAEQVAVAVLADVLAVRSGRRAQSPRDRLAPLHAPTAYAAARGRPRTRGRRLASPAAGPEHAAPAARAPDAG